MPDKCPKCSGPLWDNAEKKASGAFKSSSPDFSCRNKDCGWKQWPPKEDGPPPPPRPRGPVTKAVPVAGAWDEIHAIYGRALHEAEKVIPAEVEDRSENLIRVATAFAICAAIKHVSGVTPPQPKPTALPTPMRDDDPVSDADDDPPLPF